VRICVYACAQMCIYMHMRVGVGVGVGVGAGVCAIHTHICIYDICSADVF